MPNNIIMADANGGDPYELARKIADGTITEYIDDKLTTIRERGFSRCLYLATFQAHNVMSISSDAFNGDSSLQALAFPKLSNHNTNMLYRTLGLNAVDFGPGTRILYGGALQYCSVLTVIVLRRIGVVALGANGSALLNTPFASGGTGGTIYIPKVLYDHLGDGTENDYLANSTWATFYGYGTITFASIEGSIYETKYADGTTIPTGG